MPHIEPSRTREPKRSPPDLHLARDCHVEMTASLPTMLIGHPFAIFALDLSDNVKLDEPTISVPAPRLTISKQLSEHPMSGSTPSPPLQVDPSLKAAARWTGLLAGPHWGGRPRPSRVEDRTGGAMLSAVAATRIVEDRRRIVAVVVLEGF